MSGEYITIDTKRWQATPVLLLDGED